MRLLKDQGECDRLTTGSAKLDMLLDGGLKPGSLLLLYGDGGRYVDFFVHKLLVKCVQPRDAGGWGAEALYMNCGNYREEKTILNLELLGSLMKAAGMDLLRGMERIHLLCAFSEQQEEGIVEQALVFLERSLSVKLVMVHNIAALFTGGSERPRKRMDGIQRLQRVIFKLWSLSSQRRLSFVATCRPNKASKRGVPEPEGGNYLKHLAGVLIYLRRRGRGDIVSAYLLKHPSLAPRRVDLELSLGGDGVGRVTNPFSLNLREELSRLKKTYSEGLKEPSRREAFNDLLKVWSSERGAMMNSAIPTVLDAMLLTAVIDNRMLISEIHDKLEALHSDLTELKRHLNDL